ncbi:uncharacterized protein BYT42DRAFT_30909 [Radiomyces spectabilis]|uniref:uncharacterized protein n=1 Tax=Radiomyces spectabilis TaxID=64574 RepID=UPI00222102BB|nr:uncharacterized protein BYT42DRAFT_30909 [Radiomyces spectabilis]KAI8394105.1 hypothetical protein BYT42DRAFT_30909 [Radiomyces spectabilis]
MAWTLFRFITWLFFDFFFSFALFLSLLLPISTLLLVTLFLVDCHCLFPALAITTLQWPMETVLFQPLVASIRNLPIPSGSPDLWLCHCRLKTQSLLLYSVFQLSSCKYQWRNRQIETKSKSLSG